MQHQRKILIQQVTVLIVASTLVSTAYVVTVLNQRSVNSTLNENHASTESQRDVDEFVQHVLTAEAALRRAYVFASERKYKEALDLIDRRVRGVLLDDQTEMDVRFLEMRIEDGLKMQTEQYRQRMQRRRAEWMLRKGIH